MALVNMTQMLQKARKEKYGVGAFNILDYNSMKAVIDAAAESHSPVIVQTSVKTVKFWGFETMMAWIRELTDRSDLPVAIHLDHCHEIDFIKSCIDAGWSSVMIDASSKPFEENMRLSREVYEMAHPENISVEVELGEIGGVEDDLSVQEEDAHLADPDKVVQFLEQVPVECFAPAIGTAHGIYKGEPRIAFDRLKEIGERVETPLALHGGTGLAGEVVQKCISLGCAKVNISTRLKHAFIDGFVDCHTSSPGEYNPLKVIQSQYEQVKEVVKSNIELFGSVNKANG